MLVLFIFTTPARGDEAATICRTTESCKSIYHAHPTNKCSYVVCNLGFEERVVKCSKTDKGKDRIFNCDTGYCEELAEGETVSC